MCGIVGMALGGRGAVSGDVIRSMAMAIEHRGPDEGGEYVASGIGLGIRRLKIIDLVTGSQPISNEDGTVWAVFNGEIYNFRSLREELSAKGHRFRTQSDTECIVHAYEEFGMGCLERLRGMFAIALWDERNRRLLLARDRMGKKPLVYAEHDGGLYFASEFQALFQAPGIPRQMDLGSLGDYLEYGYVPAPHSIYRDVRKVLPGCALIWEGGRGRVERYWRIQYEPKLAVDETEALEGLEERLAEAVRLRMVADVPVGALLSGGVDSSLVVALMASQSTQRIKTFSIGFDEADFNETPHARRVAERYETDHHELLVQPDAAEILPTLVRHYGEPYADSSAIPTFYVCRMTREHVTVALTGDGGDEAFAGYDRYRAMVLTERMRRIPSCGRLSAAAGAAVARARVLPPRTSARARRFLQGASRPTRERYAGWVGMMRQTSIREVLEPEVARQVEQSRRSRVEQALDEYAGLDMVDRVLATDVETYLPDDLLVKIDIASMANSLETRAPLLDQEVVSFAAQLPPRYKLHGSVQKYLLKQLARKYVPAENVDRPKRGFGVPVGSWLRGPLREMAREALLGASESSLMRSRGVARLWDEHQAGFQDHTSSLWTLLMLRLWQRQYETLAASGIHRIGMA